MIQQRFQSTLPARGATELQRFVEPLLQFQSTLPARGATGRPHLPLCVAAISIHAPRTGSDLPWLSAGCGQSRISIHAPRTGSDMLRHFDGLFLVISIHAPRTGSDRTAHGRAGRAAISIHAPRTGSDHGRRVRQWWTPTFQSTLPARGATKFRKVTCVLR
mgnify:CR=1 FL=1